MTKLRIFIAASLGAVLLAASTISSAAAWHPKGVIVKKVQNQTAQSILADADSAKDALNVNTGDTLKYVITVSNVGTPDSRGYNDMAYTKLTDSLPAGVELVSNPSQRIITAELGTIKPGQSVTKEYLVKVTSKTNGAVIDNKACFTGDSTVKDNPQQGCNNAVVKVAVPTPPVTIPEPPKSTPQVLSAETPKTLPNTGPEQLLASAVGVGAIGYGASAYVRSRRNLATSLKR